MTEVSGGGNLTTSSTVQSVMAQRRGKRVSYTITNYGATLAWLMISDTQTAAVGYGVPLYPGTSIADSSSDYYKCWQGAITTVDNGAGGATTLAFSERVNL